MSSRHQLLVTRRPTTAVTPVSVGHRSDGERVSEIPLIEKGKKIHQTQNICTFIRGIKYHGLQFVHGLPGLDVLLN